jgi:hypothetical protein
VADSLAVTLSMSTEERGAVLAFLRDNSPEQIIQNPKQPPRVLQEVDWGLMQKWIFLAVCGHSMRRFQYEMGETPVAHPAAPVLSLNQKRIKFDLVNVDRTSRQAIELPGGFELRPAERGRPAPIVRFRSVPAWKEMRLRGALVHGACEGASIYYAIRIAEPNGREIFAKQFVVGPGDAFELDESFSCSTWFVDLEVSTSVSSHGVAWLLGEEEEGSRSFFSGSEKVLDGGEAQSKTPPWLRPLALARARVVGLSCVPQVSEVLGAPRPGDE